MSMQLLPSLRMDLQLSDGGPYADITSFRVLLLRTHGLGMRHLQ